MGTTKSKSSTLTVNESPTTFSTMTSVLEAESWIDRADHPLMNDVVLETLFEYLHLDELRSCRLTCKKWNDLSLVVCRTRFLVNVPPGYTVAEEEKSKFLRFLKLMKTNTLGIPFAHYRLCAINPLSPAGQQFSNLCGNTAKGYILETGRHLIEDVAELLKLSPMLESLTLPFDMTSKNGRGTANKPNIIKLFPGLEDTKPKLNFLKSLTTTDENGINRQYICPSFYEELIGVAPNISTLDLRTATYQRYKNSCEEVLKCIEKLGRESTIQSLKLSLFEEDILDILRKMVAKPNGMKLKHLDIVIHACWKKQEEGHLGILNKVMCLFKDSLISLRITYDCYTGYDQTMWFPPMPKLKRLELHAQDSFLTRKNFSQTFPVLEELKFTSGRNEENRFNCFINLDDEDSSVVKSLSVGANHVKMNTLNRILILFPTLTKLECQIGELDGSEVLNKIWTDMTQLEELIIIGRLRKTLNLDSLVTGIPVPIIKQIRLSNYKILDSLGELDLEARKSKLLMLVNEYRTLPSIGNLTNLRTLRMDLTRVTTELATPQHLSFITDVTGYFGFYSLRNLRNLHINMCNFSTTCAEMLVKDKCLLTWKFKNSPRFSVEILPRNLSHDDRNCVWISESGMDYAH